MGAGVIAAERGAASGADAGAGDVPALEARSLYALVGRADHGRGPNLAHRGLGRGRVPGGPFRLRQDHHPARALGLTRPLSGQVLLHGEDITGTPGHVSYMLQKDLLLPSRRIIDNVCLPMLLTGVPRAEARAKAEPLFERFGLAGTEEKWPAELSGGMRQRAAFMRTYLMGADVTLLDEPFSALDAITRVEVRRWFCDMARELGLSALVITHDVDEGGLDGESRLRAGRASLRGRAKPRCRRGARGPRRGGRGRLCPHAGVSLRKARGA